MSQKTTLSELQFCKTGFDGMRPSTASWDNTFQKEAPQNGISESAFLGTTFSSLTSHCHDNDHLVKPACMFTSQPKTDPKLVTPTCLAKNIELWDKCCMTITTPTLANNYSFKQQCIGWGKSSYKQDGQTQIPLQTLFTKDNPIPSLGRPSGKKVISYDRLLKTSRLPSLPFIYHKGNSNARCHFKSKLGNMWQC